MTSETVLAKIAKLHAMAVGAAQIGNQAEAAAFGAKVQELLIAHELEMTDVEYASRADNDPFEKSTLDPENEGIAPSRRRVAWQERLASAISRAFFCQLMVIPGSNRLIFIGRRSHRSMAVYVYSRLVRDIERLQKEERQKLYVSSGYDSEAVAGFNASFRNAFVSTVAQRLAAADRERENQMRAEGSGTALVRLNNAREDVAVWMKANVKTGGSASGLSGHRGYNAAGQRAGAAHGSRADLGANGVTTGSSGKLLS